MLTALNVKTNEPVDAEDLSKIDKADHPQTVCPGFGDHGQPCRSKVTLCAPTSERVRPYFRPGPKDPHVDGCKKTAATIQSGQRGGSDGDGEIIRNRTEGRAGFTLTRIGSPQARRRDDQTLNWAKARRSAVSDPERTPSAPRPQSGHLHDLLTALAVGELVASDPLRLPGGMVQGRTVGELVTTEQNLADRKPGHTGLFAWTISKAFPYKEQRSLFLRCVGNKAAVMLTKEDSPYVAAWLGLGPLDVDNDVDFARLAHTLERRAVLAYGTLKIRGSKRPYVELDRTLTLDDAVAITHGPATVTL